MFDAMFLRELAFVQPRLGCTHTYYICNQNGSTLQLTRLIQMEYPTLLSWTCPLPFLVDIITDQDLCAFVKTASLHVYQIFPHLKTKQETTKKIQHFNHRGYSVSMTMCERILHFLVHFRFDCDTQIG